MLQFTSENDETKEHCDISLNDWNLKHPCVAFLYSIPAQYKAEPPVILTFLDFTSVAWISNKAPPERLLCQQEGN